MSDFIPNAAGDDNVDLAAVDQVPKSADKLIPRRAVEIEGIGIDPKVDTPRVERSSSRRK
jgi:hypothetical protein